MKFLKVLVAALVLVAMAAPVIAEDRLSLSGEMRARMFHTDNQFDSFTDGLGNAHKDSGETATFANQRLRIAGKIAVAEGVSVTFRTDITEGTNWGDSSSFGSGPGNPERSNGFGHARSGSQQQWDRAHLDLTKDIYHLRAGQQYVGTGGTFAVDTQDSGLALDILTSFAPIKAFFIVDNDYASTSVGDAFLSGLMISPKGDNYSARFFVANAARSGVAAGAFGKSYASELGALGLTLNGKEENVWLIGASASTTLGPVKLFGELDFFTGDSFDIVETATGDTESTDAFGTQLFVDASMAASDAVTVGGQLFYALGDDEDIQYTRLGNGFNGWDPVYDVGTSLSNEQIGFGSPFNIAQASSANSDINFSGASAGVVGGRLYTDWKASDAWTIGASAGYFTEEDDDVVEIDVMVLALGSVYKIMENTSIQLQVQYSDGSLTYVNPFTEIKMVDDVDFDSFRAGSGIFVKF